MAVAINDQTGEVLVSGPDGAWKPAPRAANEKGETVYHDGTAWQPYQAKQSQAGDMEMLRSLGQGDFAPTQRPASWENGPTPRSVLDKGAEELKRLGIGFERGVGDVVAGGTQLGAHVLPAGVVSPATTQAVDRAVAARGADINQSRIAQAQGDRTDAQARAAYGEPGYILRDVQQDDQGRASHTVEPFGIPSGKPGFDIGRMAGNVAVTAPAAAFGPVAGSVIGSTLMPVESGDFLQGKSVQALTGLATGTAAKAIGGMVAPQVSDDAKAMARLGARPTAGQLGIVDKHWEDKLTSLPFTGGVVEKGQRAGFATFNRGTINRALEPLDDVLPKHVPDGREAVKWAGDRVSKVYNDVLPKVTYRPGVDPDLLPDIQQRWAPLIPYFKEGDATRLQNIVKERVMYRIQQNGGVLDGKLGQQIHEELGEFVRKASSNGDMVGEGVEAVKEAITAGIGRQNPQYAEILKKADAAWARMVRVEAAAGNRSTSVGLFTPGDLLAGVKKNDSTVRDRGFARGTALMQDVGEAGQTTIGNKYPDSGTAGRSAQTSTPDLIAGALGYLPAKAAYSAPARGFMSAWANPGPTRELLAEALRRGAPIAAPGVGGAMAREKELEALARLLLPTGSQPARPGQ